MRDLRERFFSSRCDHARRLGTRKPVPRQQRGTASLPGGALRRSGGEARLASRPALPQLLSEEFEALIPSARAIIHLVYSGHSRQEVAEVLSISCEGVDACLTSWRAAHPGRLVSSDSHTTRANCNAEH